MEELNHTEQKIINYLKRWCLGKERAHTYKNIAWSLEINERELRKTVAHLITDHHLLIGTISTGGYFLIENRSEYAYACNELGSRIDKLRKRLDGLNEGWADKTKGQQRLFEEARL